MPEITEQYCPKCGYKVDPEDRFCVGCGKKIAWQEEPIPLSEADVKDIPIIDKTPIEIMKEKKGKVKNKDFWLAGASYVSAGVIGLTLILMLGKFVAPVFFLLAIIILLSAIALFGAFQIQLDPANQNISFLKLMFRALSIFFAFLGRENKPNQPGRPTT
jgi:zinc-ribbon domain